MPYEDSFYIDYTNRQWDRLNRESAFYDMEADSLAAALRRQTSRTACAKEWDADDVGDLTFEVLGSMLLGYTSVAQIRIGATRSNALTADMFAMQWASIGTLLPTSACRGCETSPLSLRISDPPAPLV
jgi:hypothetical protein